MRAPRPLVGEGVFKASILKPRWMLAHISFLLPVWPRLGSYIRPTIAVLLDVKERARGCVRAWDISINFMRNGNK